MAEAIGVRCRGLVWCGLCVWVVSGDLCFCVFVLGVDWLSSCMCCCFVWGLGVELFCLVWFVLVWCIIVELCLNCCEVHNAIRQQDLSGEISYMPSHRRTSKISTNYCLSMHFSW